MPVPYSLDLRWRIVWAYLTHRLSYARIAVNFAMSERTVRRYVALFQMSGDVERRRRKHGPKPMLGEFFLFRMILQHPGIYLSEMKEEISNASGVGVCIFSNTHHFINVFITQGTVNGDKFTKFVEKYLLPILFLSMVVIPVLL